MNEEEFDKKYKFDKGHNIIEKQNENEEEFLKEHPSLKSWEGINWFHSFGIDQMECIHETQIDKQKINEVIEEIHQDCRVRQLFCDGYRFESMLREKLGLRLK